MAATATRVETSSTSVPKDVLLGDQHISPSSYAFLVHSQNTLNHNLPPDVDNPPLARQKRRRTSPEDQNILEAEYARNPKPDKAARMLIVDRVALGEKEVQIWFQNRRQITRRKAQPLSTYEIISNLRSSQESIDSFIGSSFSTVENNDQHASADPSAVVSVQPTLNETCKLSGLEPKMVNQNKDHGIVDAEKPTDANPFVSQTATPKQNSVHPPRPKEIPGYLANRRSGLFAVHQEHHTDKFSSSLLKNTEPSSLMTIPALPLKHASSLVRLSLSLDGKARVVTGSDSSSSSPRAWSPHGFNLDKRPAGGLQRSHSAVEAYQLPSAVPKRPMLGRSRDARTWEFYCDSEAGNALTVQAELEKTGSAVGAIGLIRSGSKSVRPNTNRCNVTHQKCDSTNEKPENQPVIKPKLGRANSSLARLQTMNGNEQRVVAKTPGKDPKRKLSSSIFEDETGDSDKENWAPGTQRRPVQRRRAAHPEGLQRGVLRESPATPSHSSSLDSLLNHEDSSPRSSRFKKQQAEEPGQENTQTDAHDKVARPMQGTSIPRGVEELEGVQNLLSLRKATWR